MIFYFIKDGKKDGKKDERKEEKKGKKIGVIHTYQKLGIPYETARQYIMEEFGTNAEEAEELCGLTGKYNTISFQLLQVSFH